MILDGIMNAGADAMSGLVDAVPDWQTSIDVSQVRTLLTSLQIWNNWLPLDQICICIGIAVGLWIAMQAVGAVLKGIEIIKP